MSGCSDRYLNDKLPNQSRTWMEEKDTEQEFKEKKQMNSFRRAFCEALPVKLLTSEKIDDLIKKLTSGIPLDVNEGVQLMTSFLELYLGSTFNRFRPPSRSLVEMIVGGEVLRYQIVESYFDGTVMAVRVGDDGEPASDKPVTISHYERVVQKI